MDIFRKDGELTKRAKITIVQIYGRIEILEFLGKDWENERIKFYGKFWRNNGRNLDDSAYRRLRELLWVLGEEYEFGNDAIKGGKEGDFIILSEKMERFVKWAYKKSKKCKGMSENKFVSMFKVYLKIKLL